MAHDRKRHILEAYEKLIGFARIVGIVGHRQTGKSTFTIKMAKEYVSLDDQEILAQAKRNAKVFVNSLKAEKSAIDECQLVPELFPALKMKVGTSSKPGRFILTGSVRFSSRKAIQESLSGRILNLEMHPLVLTELLGLPNSKAVLRLIQAQQLRDCFADLTVFTGEFEKIKKAILQYLECGGLPGLCFIRSSDTRTRILKDLLALILDRDIRLVYPTTVSMHQLLNLCEEIARSPFEAVNYQAIQRSTGLSPMTLKKLLYAMESVYLLRRIPIEGDSKGELFWFEDQVERAHFSSLSEPDESDLLTLFYRNVRAQFSYRVTDDLSYFSYKTRGGAFVPLALKSKDRRLGVFAFKSQDEISRSRIASAESFLKRYEQSRVVFCCLDLKKPELLTDRLAILPLTSVLT